MIPRKENRTTQSFPGEHTRPRVWPSAPSPMAGFAAMGGTGCQPVIAGNLPAIFS